MKPNDLHSRCDCTIHINCFNICSIAHQKVNGSKEILHFFHVTQNGILEKRANA